jgi:hypothetical protein
MSNHLIDRPATGRSLFGALAPAPIAAAAPAAWQIPHTTRPNLVEAAMTTLVAGYFALIGIAMLLG